MYPERGADLVDMCERFGLLTLEERRTISSILFVVKLLRGLLDCPQFLELLPLRVPPVNSRYQVPFYLPLASSTLALSSPLYCACNASNLLVTFSEGSIDIMHTPLSSIYDVAVKFVKTLRP